MATVKSYSAIFIPIERYTENIEVIPITCDTFTLKNIADKVTSLGKYERVLLEIEYDDNTREYKFLNEYLVETHKIHDETYGPLYALYDHIAGNITYKFEIYNKKTLESYGTIDVSMVDIENEKFLRHIIEIQYNNKCMMGLRVCANGERLSLKEYTNKHPMNRLSFLIRGI